MKEVEDMQTVNEKHTIRCDKCDGEVDLRDWTGSPCSECGFIVCEGWSRQELRSSSENFLNFIMVYPFKIIPKFTGYSKYGEKVHLEEFNLTLHTRYGDRNHKSIGFLELTKDNNCEISKPVSLAEYLELTSPAKSKKKNKKNKKAPQQTEEKIPTEPKSINSSNNDSERMFILERKVEELERTVQKLTKVAFENEQNTESSIDTVENDPDSPCKENILNEKKYW